MNILDTDMLSIVQRSKGADFESIKPKLDKADAKEVFVTIVSFEEQMRGWLTYVSRMRKTKEQIAAYAKLCGLLTDFCGRNLLEYDEHAADKFSGLRKSRIRISTMDLKIAAIALVRNATLVTRNISDFQKVPGLTIADWTK